MKLQDRVGMRFGSITVLSYDEVNHNLICQCDCGTICTYQRIRLGSKLRCKKCRDEAARLTKLNKSEDEKLSIKLKKQAAFKNWSTDKKKAYREKMSIINSKTASSRSPETQARINKSTAETQKLNLAGYETDSIKRLKSIWNSMMRRAAYDDYYKTVGICEAWQDKDIFIEWALANGYKPGLTIDRIDNFCGYYPENCRWVNVLAQNRNRRNSHKYLDVHIFDWADAFHLNYYEVKKAWYNNTIANLINEFIQND